MKKIVVGISGGVDSSVTAYLLKQQGHEVSAIFMQNWETDNDNPFCSVTEDLKDAQAVCDHLNIKLTVLDFSRQYWQKVFEYCLDEFSAGRTPNPDIYCNQEIKFKCLLNYVLSEGYDYLATGHYAIIKKENTDQYRLYKGLDATKDQSYFLYTLGQEQLSHCLFPLGNYQKADIRKIAKSAKLPTFNKKDSTGICFIGERKFKDFLKEFLLTKPGIIQSEFGKEVSHHEGLMFYTIGQRKGLNIGGLKESLEEPWYVIEKNLKENILVVAQGHDNQRLLNDNLECLQLKWISGQLPKLPLTCTAKIRYRQADQECQLSLLKEGLYQVEFKQKQRAITPGQSIVFYFENECLGGGIIEK